MAASGTAWATAVSVWRKVHVLLWSVDAFLFVLIYFALLMLVPHPRDEHWRGLPRQRV
jgi:uncharacterized protein YggT (Ycf19 family)